MGKRKSNPGDDQYLIVASEPTSHIQLFFSGDRFSDTDPPYVFSSERDAVTAARFMLKRNRPLRERFKVEVQRRHKHRATGRWLLNPIPLVAFVTRASEAKSLADRAANPSKLKRKSGREHNLKAAARLLEDFSGHSPSEVLTVTENNFREGLVIGTLDAVPYTTVRAGKTEHYLHEFKKTARPLLVSSSDGRSLKIVGGRFRFTEAGIIDE